MTKYHKLTKSRYWLLFINQDIFAESIIEYFRSENVRIARYSIAHVLIYFPEFSKL
jgi:hypothetical protein